MVRLLRKQQNRRFCDSLAIMIIKSSQSWVTTPHHYSNDKFGLSRHSLLNNRFLGPRIRLERFFSSSKQTVQLVHKGLANTSVGIVIKGGLIKR